MAENHENHDFQTRKDLANEYRRMLKNARLKPSQKLQIGKALAEIEGWKVVQNETDFEKMSDEELLQQVLQVVSQVIKERDRQQSVGIAHEIVVVGECGVLQPRCPQPVRDAHQ